VTAVAYGALIVFCGLMLILFSREGGGGGQDGRLGIRLTSAFLFAAMGGLFLMNQRHLFVYI
jgi:hypothetical protein